MAIRHLSAALILLLPLVAAPRAWAADKLGIVLMHAEMGAPGRAIADLGDALGEAGYLVSQPDMCWSARRGYEAVFPACLSTVDDAIVRLRNLGATHIVVGGFSLGATAALAYGATHPGLAGIIAIAPAHDAQATAQIPDIAADFSRAKGLVAQGKGDVQAEFDDLEIGPSGPYTTEIATTPDIYVSFLGPSSAASIAGSLPRLTAPLLWIAGTQDPSQASASALFAQAPANPRDRFVTVSAGHLATPAHAIDAVLAWLKDFSAR